MKTSSIKKITSVAMAVAIAGTMGVGATISDTAGAAPKADKPKTTTTTPAKKTNTVKKVKVAAPAITKVKKVSQKKGIQKIRISWSKVDKADGYTLYIKKKEAKNTPQKTVKKESYKTIAKYKVGVPTSKTVRLGKGSYVFKVKALRTVGGKTVTSKASKGVKYTVKVNSKKATKSKKVKVTGLYAEKYKVTDNGRSIVIGQLHYPAIKNATKEAGSIVVQSRIGKKTYAFTTGEAIKDPTKAGVIKNFKITFADKAAKKKALKSGRVTGFKITVTGADKNGKTVKETKGQKTPTLHISYDKNLKYAH